MPATGAGCPRKNVAVADANISGSDAHTECPNQLECQSRLAMLAAGVYLAAGVAAQVVGHRALAHPEAAERIAAD